MQVICYEAEYAFLLAFSSEYCETELRLMYVNFVCWIFIAYFNYACEIIKDIRNISYDSSKMVY